MTPNNQINVCVLSGGIGSERQVSLAGGRCVAEALRSAEFGVIESDISPQNTSILQKGEIDVFFPVLHGKFGEDGGVQALFEKYGLCYIGSGPEASKKSFDKILSKEIFRKAGVPVAGDVVYSDPDDEAEIEKTLSAMGEKFVVKPIREGSSVGVCIIEGVVRAIQKARECYAEFANCMIERFISGREITVGIVNGRTLPIVEVVSKGEFYDYKAKYEDDATEYLFDTIEGEDLLKRLDEIALVCFNVLDCRHIGRVDMIVDDVDNIFVLEMNTLPGFTTHSLVPKAAAHSGLPIDRLCEELVRQALRDRRRKM